MQHPTSINLAEFLEWEARQPSDERYEFLDGQIVALGQSATQAHNRLVVRLTTLVAAHEGMCRTFSGMQRLIAAESATFPDVVLTCDERDFAADDQTTIRYPKLLAEVLSSSTAGTDLTKKLRAHATIQTLEEYLVVDSRERHVMIFRRVGPDLAAFKQVTTGTIVFHSIGASLDVDALYAGVLA